ncbi:4118_t:CDS:2 [Paraglomus brasilianum]|uniref:4118_t:CDS:1 n=1 Tax=Paraglomus brasilianum TaxID=144538 RepID=A0A9N9AXV7_9GLOM|nr:4118_t:CDS:2 [Paraglomus brasilianum]
MHLGDYETALSISLSINVDTNTRTGCMIEILRALLRGDTYGLVGIWQEVVNEYQRAEALCKQNGLHKMYANAGSFRLSKAFVEMSKKVHERARSQELLENTKSLVLDYLDLIDDPQILRCLYGSSCLLLDDAEQAIENYSQALLNQDDNRVNYLSPCQTVYYDKDWISASSTIGLGIAYHKVGRYDDALEFYDKALSLTKKREGIQDDFNAIVEAIDLELDKLSGRIDAIAAYNSNIIKYHNSFTRALAPTQLIELSMNILPATSVSIYHHMKGFTHLLKHKNHQEAQKEFTEAQQNDAAILEGFIARQLMNRETDVGEIIEKLMRDEWSGGKFDKRIGVKERKRVEIVNELIGNEFV